MKFWTWLNIVTILIGPLAWFIFFGIQYSWDDQLFYFQSPYFGAFSEVMGGALFWADFFLVICICMVPSLLEYFAKGWFDPNPIGKPSPRCGMPLNSLYL
jgi:phospholipid-translocating ATPase/phospholipid-transporting ATPase